MYAIGEAARKSGVHIETIRYFERIGLLKAVKRHANGRRYYSEDHINRLRFVRRSRALGMSQARVRRLVELLDGGNWSCDGIKGELDRQILETRSAIADLQRLDAQLSELSALCEGGVAPDCHALDRLYA